MIMSAARAGGIIANSQNQKIFLDNVEIQNSLLKIALKKGLKEQFFRYIVHLPKTIKNTYSRKSLLTGPLEKTNQCYAIRKFLE